jgi:hypothetical protein
VDGHNSVAGVVFPGEQGLGLDAVHHLAEGFEFAFDVGGNVFAFPRQFQIGSNIAAAAGQVGFSS